RIQAALTEERTVRLQTYPVSDYQKEVVVSDEEIQAWYDANKESLMVADQVAVQYLVLDEEAAMQAVTEVAEADLRSYYEQNKSRYVTPPRVNVSHIQISTPAGASEEERNAAREKAEALAQQVKAEPATFADVAREASQDVGTARDGGQLGWVRPSTWPAALEQAVFALKAGEVSDVVEGPDGFHVFIANEVEAENGESLGRKS